VRAVRDRQLVVLAGPRRFGKTSLLGQVAATAGQVDALDAVRVDCFGVASVGEFGVRLERSMDGLTGPARKLARRLFAASELGLSIAPGVGFKASFGRKDAPDPTAALHEILATLVAISERRGGLLLVLDEFQDAGHVTGLDAILRTHLQEARRVARAVDGHPQRLMLVAHLLWERVAPGGVARADDVSAALEIARDRTEAEHRAVVESLDRTHRDTLRAVASFSTPYSRVAERALVLGRSSAQAAVAALEAEALLSRDGERWRIVDPLLSDWLRARLPVPGS
jgi:hypothetical protein